MIFLVKMMAITGGLLIAATFVTGCGLQNFGRAANHETLGYEVKDKVARVVLVGHAGDIEIGEADADVVEVEETLRWSSRKPVAEHKVEGDALVLTYECPHAMDNCSVGYVVTVPKGLRVEVETGSGDVRLKALSGPIKAKVGSGDLDGDGMTGSELRLEAGSGDATLKYASAPDNVDVVAGSGDAKIMLPDGPYNVNADTNSGDTTVSVATDPKSPHKVVIRTGSGDVSLLPA
ncbi:DUF4097 family beta strand repeat-containing protein [Microtetraspora niveoalba]|uniref:DUF4097 family beta strand repeat-containing protein n=1 Tax=Microtetraspora niveoalba TaxID=46175 RepID=UPI000AFBAC44|nr:DUF4097 family beta strand repeat-containing protein [Microtetraspora niveoalba]